MVHKLQVVKKFGVFGVKSPFHQDFCGGTLPVSVSQTSAALDYINQRGLRISVIQHKAPTSNILRPSYFASPIPVFAKNVKRTGREKPSIIDITKVDTVPVP